MPSKMFPVPATLERAALRRCAPPAHTAILAIRPSHAWAKWLRRDIHGSSAEAARRTPAKRVHEFTVSPGAAVRIEDLARRCGGGVQAMTWSARPSVHGMPWLASVVRKIIRPTAFEGASVGRPRVNALQ